MLNGMYIHIIKNILYVYFGIFVIFKNILCVCIDIRVVYLYIWLIETLYTNFKTNIYRIYVMNNQKIEHQSVIVFTSESKDSLVKNGGSRAWRSLLGLPPGLVSPLDCARDHHCGSRQPTGPRFHLRGAADRRAAGRRGVGQDRGDRPVPHRHLLARHAALGDVPAGVRT